MTALVWRLSGEVTIGEAESALDVLRRTVAVLQAGQQLDLDLSEVAELDTAGLQLLLLAHREALARGASAQVSGASKAARRTLALAWRGPDLAPLPPLAPR